MTDAEPALDLEPRLSSSGGKHDIHIKASRRDPDDPDITHSHVWWFKPVMQTGPENARLTPSQYLHKTYTDSCKPTAVTEEYEGEEIVESVGWVDENTLDMTDVPDPVVERLLNWFGRDIVERSVTHDGGTLPTNHYECVDCDGEFDIPPRRTCPECGSDSLVKYVDA